MKNSLHAPCVTQVDKKWLLIDAKGAILGRLASQLAIMLRGKHKAQFTPNMDNGDNIVVINAKHVNMKANKLKTKKHFWHTGYIGGIKSISIFDRLQSAQCTNVIRDAVKGMLPKNRLGDKILGNLHIYEEDQHKHQAQQPQVYDFISNNRKNK